MPSKETVLELKRKSIDIREKTLEQIAAVGRGHVGGSLSVCELMSCLYYHIMDVDPENPRKPDRDRFVMSKGHAGPALYAALAMKGYFPQEKLATLNQPGTMLPSHTDMNLTPGVDMTTGSLGQGFSSALGIALANKLKGRNCWTYILLGDGECDEGQVWEAAMFAAAKGLDKVITFVDYNGKQLDGAIQEVMPLESLQAKFESFGWQVQDLPDGHDEAAIVEAVEAAKLAAKPSLIILRTVKGKGWSFSEKEEANHNMPVSAQQLAEAKRELDAQRAALQEGR